MRASLTRITLAAGAIALAVLMTGCSGAGATGTLPSHRATTTPSAQPTQTAPAQPKDVLFTISANVRSKSGSTIGILLTAHKPLPYSDSNAKPLISNFIASCGAGVGGIPVTTTSLATNGSIMVAIDVTSSVPGKPFIYPIKLDLGSPYFGQSATGKGIAPADPTQPCYGGYQWSTSGDAHAVADFESGIPGPDLKLWRYGFYGFSVPFDSGSTIEACKVTLSDLAKADDVASVSGWDPTQAASGVSCQIGAQQE